MTLPKIALQRGKVRVGDFLKRAANARKYDTLGIAVAYATIPGVRELLDSILVGKLPAKSYWVFGLDDCITHPDGIELAMSLPGATVKVAHGGGNGGKFHPKLYWFSGKDVHSSLVLGSANLTRNGLRENVEAVAEMAATGNLESAKLDAVWYEAWALGRRITPRLLADYRKEFSTASAARRKISSLSKNKFDDGKPKKSRTRSVLSNDAASIDPTFARTCWIEVGNITGFKQDQLEIKAEQALFFGLQARGAPDACVLVKLATGSDVRIPVKYYSNHMWRFRLPQAIPEVAIGLRPYGKRSPLVAVFERKGKDYTLCFIKKNSKNFKQLHRATEQAGTLGHTTSRQYGWT